MSYWKEMFPTSPYTLNTSACINDLALSSLPISACMEIWPLCDLTLSSLPITYCVYFLDVDCMITVLQNWLIDKELNQHQVVSAKNVTLVYSGCTSYESAHALFAKPEAFLITVCQFNIINFFLETSDW